MVDKGDKVEAGQILAEIESPEVEQQFAAASADLVHKRRNLARIKELYSKGNTTQVAMYQAETDATVAENNVGVLATSVSLQDRACAVRRPGDGALRRSGRTGHQLADQHHQRHADDDALGRQPGFASSPTCSRWTCRSCKLATAPSSAMRPIRSATRSARSRG